MELRAERQRKRDREEREKDLYAAEADIGSLPIVLLVALKDNSRT